MTDLKIAAIIKAHYDHTSYRPISSYMVYIGSQVTRRIGDNINSDIKFRGVQESNKKSIDGIFNGNSYLDYMSDRSGSTGMFTDPNFEILQVIRDASNYKGYYFMPFLSMREIDARKFGVLSQSDFENAVVLAMREMPSILKIQKRDFRYLAAFHIKPIEKQNNSGAGKQPHVHFIIWDQSNDRRKFRMSEKEYERFRASIFKHLFSKHRSQYYLHRNKLREEMLFEIDRLLKEDLNIKPILGQIKKFVNNLRNGSGSLHYGAFLREHRFIKLNNEIKSKYEDSKTIDFFLKMKNVEYTELFENIEKLVSYLTKTGNMSHLVNEWKNLTIKMREYEGSNLIQKSIQEDFNSLLTIINNKIIRKATYQSELIKSSVILNELSSFIESGVLKYKDTSNSVILELARILVRASYFEHNGDKSKMTKDINHIRTLLRDSIDDVNFFSNYYQELVSMNILANKGFYFEELELIDTYLEIEHTKFLPKNNLTILEENQWISTERYGLVLHTKIQTKISQYIEDQVKIDMQRAKENFSFPKVNKEISEQIINLDNRTSNFEIETNVPSIIIDPNKSKDEKKKKSFKLQKAPTVIEDFEEDQVLIESTIEYDLSNEEAYSGEVEEAEDYYYLDR